MCAFLFYVLNIEQEIFAFANQVPARGGDLGVGQHTMQFLFDALDIEKEVHYISVFYNIFFAFDADFACIAASFL